jgi:E3 ubiquitin-protein ligase RNF144
MDVHSAKLAVELQLDDINALLDDLYNDPPEGDQLRGFETMKNDLQHQLQVLEGQVLVHNILKTEYTNRQAFKKLLEEEKQALGDHQLAMKMQGVQSNDANSRKCADYEASLCGGDGVDGEGEQWQVAKRIYAAETNTAIKEETSIKKRGPHDGLCLLRAGGVRGNTKAPRLDARPLLKLCNSCLESKPAKDILTLECAPEPHIYCRVCLVDLFQTALHDTTLFPPRCCRVPIPLDMCRALLPKALVKEFDLKVEELATPNPTYCADPECAKFISPNSIKNDDATCVFCKKKTCVTCKSKQHDGLCPEDPHVKLLMDAAKRSKWQQCSRCKNLVELGWGCYHMT